MKLFFYFALLLLFVGCGFGQREKEASFDSAAAERAAAIASLCDQPMRSAFGQSYHGFLITNCQSCHVVGGQGKGAFSSPDLEVAFNAFKGASAARVNSFAVNPNHKPPDTGTQHSATISSLSTQWEVVENQYQSCLASGGGGGGGGIAAPTGPRIETVAKVMPTFTVPAPGVTTAVQTLTFNLGSELALPVGTTFPGSSFSFDIKVRTSSSGETSYMIERPVFAAAGSSAYQVQDIQIKLNGVRVDSATALTTTVRKIPAGQNRVLVPLVGGQPTGVFIIEKAIVSTDTLTVTFGAIVATNFNPPTHAQLIAASGASNVFQRRCTSCHSGGAPAAGMNITDRNGLINSLRVISFFPSSSLLVQRMKSATAPMPTAGLVPASELQMVEDWILDGAP